ncbi:MAG TPA: serine hydrolase domain-containing protein [Chloroflexia bacterium]|nr:serine hydrolase domain-containing protein [Chloroflexia bacterium]
MDLTRLALAGPIIDDAVNEGPYPAAAVAVATARETVWAHVAPGRDNAALDSIFPVASLTKPMTATAVFQLVEQGKLLLNVPVARYLPEFAANGKERVTAWHLLTHSSGLEEDQFYGELQALGTTPPPGWLFEAACRSHLNFEPGSAHKYTTLTFSVLAELVRRLSGLPHPEYMRRHIFEPLGMKDTGFSPRDRSRATPQYDLGTHEQMSSWETMADPGGGAWSTVADLVRFGQAYLRGGEFDGYRLISPASIAVMTGHYTQGVFGYGTTDRFNYGAGWGKPSLPRNGDLLASERAFGHGGATGCLLWIDPEYGFVYVFLSNRWNLPDPNDTRARVLNIVYGAAGSGS